MSAAGSSLRCDFGLPAFPLGAEGQVRWDFDFARPSSLEPSGFDSEAFHWP